MSEQTPPSSPTRRKPDLLTDYITKRRGALRDFEALDDVLGSLPLFQSIQIVHRFLNNVGPRVTNRHAFLVSIVRSTQRWWNEQQTVVEEGPNTALVVQLCMQDLLSPDVFTPAVCHTLQLLTQEQVVQVAQGFNAHSLALHVANDSHYAKQQLFLSMAQSALMEFNKAAATGFVVENSTSEASAVDAATTSSFKTNILSGLLTEFIARTCAKSKNIREADLDVDARLALNRVELLQAMQAIQHFQLSVSDQIEKRSAYLMGILRGQVTHWERSMAAKVAPGGAKQLLRLHPRVLLIIVHLCLDGNLVPSDFGPEVCLEFVDLDCEISIKAIKAFNSNRRIAAGAKGGITNRVRFFHSLMRNIRNGEGLLSGEDQWPKKAPVVSSPSFMSFVTGAKEMNPHTIPFTPSSPRMTSLSILHSASPDLSVARKPASAASTPELNPQAKPFIPNASHMMLGANASSGQLNRNDAVNNCNGSSPTVLTSASGGLQNSLSSSSNGPNSVVVLGMPSSSPMSSAMKVAMSPASVAVTLPSLSSTVQSPERQAIAESARLTHLLESSRDAIAFLTSALARSRTSEIRLRRELTESQAQVQHLTSTLMNERENGVKNLEAARQQIVVNVFRNFDNLTQKIRGETFDANNPVSDGNKMG